MLTETDRSVGPAVDDPQAFQSGGSCKDNAQCQPGTVCFNNYCVGQGSLRFSLAFTVDSDFDLHVQPPGANEIYYAQRDGGGGRLDVDQCVDPCGVGSHVENVFFQTPANGNYQFWVVNYEARASGPFEVFVEAPGRFSQRYSGFLNPPSGSSSQIFGLAY
jgi:uncharacterized protein YfaP (DUF2135 family)